MLLLIVKTVFSLTHFGNFYNMIDKKNYLIHFAHGKESGPWGSKIIAMSDVAKSKGLAVESLDYAGIDDPTIRVNQLIEACKNENRHLILVGSSMGSYVVSVASKVLNPKGLFLLAPAFYIPLDEYVEKEPQPVAEKTVVIHGWQDEIIPYAHSIKYAEKYQTELILINGNHRLTENIDFICHQFNLFLESLLK